MIIVLGPYADEKTDTGGNSCGDGIFEGLAVRRSIESGRVEVIRKGLDGSEVIRPIFLGFASAGWALRSEIEAFPKGLGTVREEKGCEKDGSKVLHID